MKILYFIPILLLLLCLQSCETYGPASRYQTTKYMEKPFFNGKDTGSFYVSGRYSGGVRYQPNDKNRSGALNMHLSYVTDKGIWSRKWLNNQYYHFGVGSGGIMGQYNVKDSLKLGYHNLGFRGEAGTHLYTDDNNTHIGMTMTLGRSYENGSFYTFRDNFEKSRSSNPNYIIEKWSTDWGFRYDIEHSFGDYKVAHFDVGVNFNYSDDYIPRFYADASYQLNKRFHLNLNYVFSSLKKGNKISSQTNFVNLGVACGF
jgi:hypothetical protein